MSTSDSVTPGLYSEALIRRTPLARGKRSDGARAALVAVEKIADLTSAAFGFTVALLLSTAKPHSWAQVIGMSLIGGLIAVLDLRGSKAYEGGSGLLQIRETERILRVSVHCSLLMIAALLTLGWGLSESVFGMAPIAVAISLMLQKRLFSFALRAVDRAQGSEERVVVYGGGQSERRVVSALLRSVRLGLQPVAVIDGSAEAVDRTVLELGYRERSSIPVVATSITPELLAAFGGTSLAVVTDGLTASEIEAATECARDAGVKVLLVSDPNLDRDSQMEFRNIDGLMVGAEKQTSRNAIYEGGKRILDLSLSLIGLLALWPVFVLIALLIKLDSAGPVLFVQDRIGLHGKVFRIFKFRSMYAESGKYEPSPTSSLDSRLSRVGRLLRRLNLDELPQLVNVVRGEMSLVGPRPEMPFIVENYSSSERRRLLVMPGITGLWQLSADRAFPIHENLEYDLYYVRNRGWFMDVAILIHTLLFAMRGGI